MKHHSIIWLLLLLAACGQNPPQTSAPPTLTVDSTLKPNVASLPALEDGVPRPLAVLTGEEGTKAAFVANELWLSTDNKAELDSFLARWQGKVIKQINSAEVGLTGLPNQYLVRINAAAASTAELGNDLKKLDPNASGAYAVSSQEALQLLTAGADEASNGVKVGLNWVGEGAQFRDVATAEAPSADTAIGGVDYSPNAFGWPSHSSGTTSRQKIGVAQAWRAMDLAGVLNNRVKLAVLDMGFQPDADFRAGWIAVSHVPTRVPIGTENFLDCGEGECPWHGTNVVSAAMAIPDNGYGSAGPAGPVATPVMIYTSYDYFTVIAALAEARIAGAKIANMSFGTPVPWYVAWTIYPFEAATKIFRETGMLLFASAGNDGKDVDKEKCTLGSCWERTWVTPCENAGVICVGGLEGNSTSRASGSNYGDKQVDIFAPYTLWVGPDPAHPGNAARTVSGTSVASPFAAGVAALIWAAKPSLSADGVEELLMNTAHKPGTANVRAYVNALGAINEALGNIPPAVSLSFPGGDVPVNVALSISADVTDFEDAFPCCTVRWTSDRDGVIGNARQLSYAFVTTGPRTLTVTATDSTGAVGTAQVNINVVNYAPVATIVRPQANEVAYTGIRMILRGYATDRNEPNEQLACSRLSWRSSLATDPTGITGCETQITFSTPGTRTITLTPTDSGGLAGAPVQVQVNVINPPSNTNLAPLVNITSPLNVVNVGRDQVLSLAGTATDPENATPLSYQWTVRVNGAAPVVIANTATAQWKPSDSASFSSEGTYTFELRLNVRDPQGNVGSDFVTFQIIIIN